MEEELSKGERTRATILAVAYNLFVTTGYHGTSMRLIADGAGLVVGGVYNHFPSKEEIFKAVVRTYHPFVTMIPQLNASSTGQTAEEILRATAQRLMAEIDRQPGLINLMFIELVEFNGQHIPELVELLLPSVFGFLERLQAAPGRLRPFSPPAIFRIFLGSIFAHYLTASLLSRSTLNQATPATGGLGTLDDVMDMFFHGIMAPLTPELPPAPVLDDVARPASFSPTPPPDAAPQPQDTPTPPLSPVEPTAPGPTWKGGRRVSPRRSV
ncbi:MAG: TetR/AcrR family transcriptional regulator [Anaerolineae bacterium]|uniref:TetR/AcrR family transcriptional regulator n=1 Tax=Candidatus Amarolinea dominans TaxID=3140696 RepID=UPI001D3BDA99|nr:TetR/AcrR family transcriptional regulator [Anaerolineae bacterium]MBK9091337.1 TetR/AcrR family transcriptional regulator [Anaerolineae bacterium]MBK9231602.1 TetR/AcrR family transcriptional regulator [Anaerolineae bacterium]